MRLFISQDPKICWILSITLWIELIFCMLTAMQYFWLDRHPTPFVWLLNASILQLYLLDPVQWPEESYEIWSAHPSVPSFFRLGVFFKLYRHFFLNFGMALETNMKLCVKSLIPLKKYWKMDQKWAKNRSFLFIGKFDH